MDRSPRYHRFSLVRIVAPLVVLYVALSLLFSLSNRWQTIVVAVAVLGICAHASR